MTRLLYIAVEKWGRLGDKSKLGGSVVKLLSVVLVLVSNSVGNLELSSQFHPFQNLHYKEKRHKSIAIMTTEMMMGQAKHSPQAGRH